MPNYHLILNQVAVVDEYTILTWQKADKLQRYIYHPIFGEVQSLIRQKKVEQYCLFLRETGQFISSSNTERRDTYFRGIRNKVRAEKRKTKKKKTTPPKRVAASPRDNK